MSIHEVRGFRIRTDNIRPPIPIRAFDWCAVDDDTYDGAGCPIGYGYDERGAIEDLLELLGAPDA